MNFPHRFLHRFRIHYLQFHFLEKAGQRMVSWKWHLRRFLPLKVCGIQEVNLRAVI